MKPAEPYEDGDELFPGIPKRAVAKKKTSRARPVADPDDSSEEPAAREAPASSKEDAEERRAPEPAPPARAPEPAPIVPRAAPRKTSVATKAALSVLALAAAAASVALVATNAFSPADAPSRARRGSSVAQLPAKGDGKAQVTLAPTPLSSASPSAQGSSAPNVTAPAPTAATKTNASPTPPPAAGPTSGKKGKTPREIATRSATHSALATILESYDPVRKVDFKSDDRLFQDYRAKDAREKELLEQVRMLGRAGIDATKDMLRELDDDGYRIFLAKALAGNPDADALKAVSELLVANAGIAVQKTLAVYMPDTIECARVLTTAFSQETNARSRVMLLDEFARRVGGGGAEEGAAPAIDGDTARAFFRKAVLEDADPVVRAEAITLIGRKGDPQDTDLMAAVAKKETQLQIRQAAIVSLGSTGMQLALPALQDLATNDPTMEVRATAVLSIAKVGTDPACRDQIIRLLEQIAQNDAREEVRSRAKANANTLRLRTKAEEEERARELAPGESGGRG